MLMLIRVLDVMDPDTQVPAAAVSIYFIFVDTYFSGYLITETRTSSLNELNNNTWQFFPSDTRVLEINFIGLQTREPHARLRPS